MIFSAIKKVASTKNALEASWIYSCYLERNIKMIGPIICNKTCDIIGATVS